MTQASYSPLEWACANAFVAAVVKTLGEVRLVEDAYCPHTMIVTPSMMRAIKEASRRFDVKYRGAVISAKIKPKKMRYLGEGKVK